MNITGKTVFLRALEDKDNLMLQELINDREIEKMICGKSFPVSYKSQVRWLDEEKNSSNIIRCAIEKIDGGQTAGTVILSDIDYANGNAEIHIKLLPKFHRQGIGKEAINLLVDYAFNQLRLHSVYAEVLEYNDSSKALFRKCGFTHGGTLKDRVFKDGKYVNVLIYSIENANVL